MVELIEFGDFMCDRCRNARQPLLTLLELYDDHITYTFKHFPNPHNPASWLAAVVAEAARIQGKFDGMYHALFRQQTLHSSTLSTLANCLGLDVERFLDDLHNEQIYNHIKADQQEGYQFNIQTTPALVIEGQRFYGSLAHARLSPVIQQHIQRKSRPIFNRVDPKTGFIQWAYDAL